MKTSLHLVSLLSLVFCACLLLSCSHHIRSDNRENIDWLIDELNYGNLQDKIDAAKSIAQIGADAQKAIPHLIVSLGNRHTHVYAALALESIGAESIPYLVRNLESKNIGQFLGAARTLAMFGAKAKDSVPDLIRILKENKLSLTKKRLVIGALGEIGQAARAAVSLLTDQLYKYYSYFKENRAYAGEVLLVVRALGSMGFKSTEMTKILLELAELNEDLEDVEAYKRSVKQLKQCSLHYLYKNTKDYNYVVKLISYLSDKDTVVQRSSAQLLGKIGNDATTAIPCLKNMISDKSKLTLPVESIISAYYALAKMTKNKKHYISELNKLKKTDRVKANKYFYERNIDLTIWQINKELPREK